MKFLKSILSKKKERGNLLSDNFSFSVKKVITEVDNINDKISDNDFYKIISNQEINQFETNEIYIFLPIAFARVWIQTVNWPEEYNEILPGEKKVTKRYDETSSFLIILEIVKSYFENTPSKSTILQIGGRSAEFHAANELLLKGGEIEDINVTKTTIIR